MFKLVIASINEIVRIYKINSYICYIFTCYDYDKSIMYYIFKKKLKCSTNYYKKVDTVVKYFVT